jgi:hypothetical protein
MAQRIVLVLLASAALPVGPVSTAAAQDAAEAAILGGSGQAQAGASRSLGTAMSNSLNAAANAIGGGTPNRGGTHSSSAAIARVRPAQAMIGSPVSSDPLAGTDAPTYRLGNGSSIRVSGGLIPAANAACVRDCR